MEALFWVALAGSVYSYVGYPLLLLVCTALRPVSPRARGASASRQRPRLSFVITARNESARIVAKVRDVLSQLDGESGEVIVVSDASDDRTDELVRAIPDERVRLLRQATRLGKEAAQEHGIRASSGAIIVFSDVATRMQTGSIAALLECFADSSVGAVSSEDRFLTSDGRVAGEGLYVRYEMWLRRLESRLAGLVGLSGSFFAARREVCTDWRTDVPSDFTIALTCARHGLRAVSHPAVIGIYPDLAEPADEYARKRRTILRGMAGLAAAREVLNPVRYGWFSFQVWSHKLLRWAVPWFLALLFITSAALAPARTGYLAFLGAQSGAYAAALAAWRWPSLQRIAPLRVWYYFALVNLAMLDALGRFLRGERIVTWNPSRR